MTELRSTRLLRLSSYLRRLRAAAGLSLDQATARSGIDSSAISRAERGHAKPRAKTLTNLLNAYGITDPQQQAAVLAYLAGIGDDDWLDAFRPLLDESYHDYISLENGAARVRTYETFVPELLQTRDYARTRIRENAPDALSSDIDRLVELRMRRQEILRRPAPVRIWAVIDEAAIRREVGGPTVMRTQLRALADATALQSVTLQILPFREGAGLSASFAVLEIDDLFGPGAVYTHHLTGGLLEDVDTFTRSFDQIAGQALDPAASGRWLIEAAELAERS